MPSHKGVNEKHIKHIPRIIIPEDILAKIFYWVDTCPMEISGLGKIEIIRWPQTGNQPDLFDFKIVDAILLEQENTSSFTELNADAVSKAMYETRESPGELRWIWHSHVNMGVFWSGTDFDTITTIGGNGWIVSSVFNKRHEHRSAFMMGQPMPIMMDFLNIECPRKSLEVDTTDLHRQYTEKVRARKYVATPGKADNYFGNGNRSGGYSYGGGYGGVDEDDWDFGWYGDADKKEVTNNGWEFKGGKWHQNIPSCTAPTADGGVWDTAEQNGNIIELPLKEGERVSLPFLRPRQGEDFIQMNNGLLALEGEDYVAARFIPEETELHLLQKDMLDDTESLLSEDPCAETDSVLKD